MGERKAAAAEARRDALQRLGRRAMRGGELLALLEDAVRAVGEVLAVEQVSLMELTADDELRLRAGAGWQVETIGAGVDRAPGGFAAFVLDADGPVAVEDLRAETRFRPTPQLLDAGVTSSLGTSIPGPEGPFGLLAAHAAEHRRFEADDAAFAVAVAAIVAQAIAAQRRALELHDSVLQQVLVALYALDLGRQDHARAALDAAIAEARAIITRHLGTARDAEGHLGPLPGDLRRDRPAGED